MISYVCPKPVWAKRSFAMEDGAHTTQKKAVLNSISAHRAGRVPPVDGLAVKVPIPVHASTRNRAGPRDRWTHGPTAIHAQAVLCVWFWLQIVAEKETARLAIAWDTAAVPTAASAAVVRRREEVEALAACCVDALLHTHTRVILAVETFQNRILGFSLSRLE